MTKKAMPPTRTVSPEEMQKNIVRFKDLKPQSSYYAKDQGIPGEAYKTITARTLQGRVWRSGRRETGRYRVFLPEMNSGR